VTVTAHLDDQATLTIWGSSSRPPLAEQVGEPDRAVTGSPPRQDRIKIDLIGVKVP
jgi:hypothetical protein